MIVMLSARRLKPGAWDQFRRAWDPGDSKPPGLRRVYHARNIRDEDEVISFGLFDMTEDDYRRWRAEADAEEIRRVDRVSAFVKSSPVEGVYAFTGRMCLATETGSLPDLIPRFGLPTELPRAE